MLLIQTDEAEAAIAQLNNFNLGGSVLEVRFADKDAGASTSDRRPPPSDNIYCKAGIEHELGVSIAHAADAEGGTTSCTHLQECIYSPASCAPESHAYLAALFARRTCRQDLVTANYANCLRLLARLPCVVCYTR